jgi:hypothetical protein
LQHSDTLSTNNFISLLNIASQCPLIGGLAVYEAQALLKSIAPELEIELDTLCTAAGYREEEQSTVYIDDKNENLTIYPNPANEFITVLCKEPIANISIINTANQTISHLKSDSNYTSIDIKDLPSGIYFIRVITNTHTYVSKLIISR